jgi:hypothetical protein
MTETTKQWFMDDEFETPLPPEVAAECARVYGRGEVGVDFAQGLAAFLAITDVLAPTQGKVTPEMRSAVAEEHCAMEGHVYTHIHGVGIDGPLYVFCTRCGKTWEVEHPA